MDFLATARWLHDAALGDHLMGIWADARAWNRLRNDAVHNLYELESVLRDANPQGGGSARGGVIADAMAAMERLADCMQDMERYVEET